MAMDPNYFWRTPRAWPDVMPGFVFLASAVQQIGKARYPVSWAGDEPWTRVPTPLPEHQPDATHAQVRQAYSLIGRELDEITLPAILPKGANKHSIPRPLSSDDWAAARLASLEVSVPRAEKAARWHDVMQITCALFRSGGLHCHVREVPGGEYSADPLDPAKCWNTELERVTARFGLCQIDLNNLYGQTAYEAHNNIRLSSYSRQAYRYMFVDDRSLANSLEAIGKIAPPPEWIADKLEPAEDAAPQKQKPHPNSAWTPAERLAARACAKWWWETYICKSKTPTHTKAVLQAEARKQSFFSEMRDSGRAFDKAFSDAVAMGDGAFDAWLLGDAAKQ